MRRPGCVHRTAGCHLLWTNVRCSIFVLEENTANKKHLKKCKTRLFLCVYHIVMSWLLWYLKINISNENSSWYSCDNKLIYHVFSIKQPFVFSRSRNIYQPIIIKDHKSFHFSRSQDDQGGFERVLTPDLNVHYRCHDGFKGSLRHSCVIRISKYLL